MRPQSDQGRQWGGEPGRYADQQPWLSLAFTGYLARPSRYRRSNQIRRHPIEETRR